MRSPVWRGVIRTGAADAVLPEQRGQGQAGEAHAGVSEKRATRDAGAAGMLAVHECSLEVYLPEWLMGDGGSRLFADGKGPIHFPGPFVKGVESLSWLCNKKGSGP